MKLSAQDRKIASNIAGMSDMDPADLERRMMYGGDGGMDEDGSPDCMEQARNHLEACADETDPDEIMRRAVAARDALNQHIAKGGGVVKSSPNAAGIVFAGRVMKRISLATSLTPGSTQLRIGAHI